MLINLIIVVIIYLKPVEHTGTHLEFFSRPGDNGL
jgi:hypothetical protein